MNSSTLIYICTFSILPGGIIAFFRFSKIDSFFHPFIYCIWLAGFNEIVSFLLIKGHSATFINNNIYVLAEAILITILFKNFGEFKKKKTIFNMLILFYCIVWVIETLIVNNINSISYYFRFIYSFVVTLISIDLINKTFVSTTERIIGEPIFLLCFGFIIYFTFKVLVYAFWIYGDTKFMVNTYYIVMYINLFVNLIYALAVLWMPKKVAFTLPYS